MRRYAGILSFLVAWAFAAADVPFEFIGFEDMKATGIEGKELPVGSCWGALGIDPNDVIYIVFGTNRGGGVIEDCTVFSWNSKTDERKMLGTLRQQAHDDGTLWEGEALPKGHSSIVHLNGKMYFGTQNFHEAGSKDDLDMLKGQYHGSHIFSIDCATGKLEDESKHMPEGVFQRGQGIIAVIAMPWNDLIVGNSHPKGDFVLYNPATRDVQIVPHDPNHLGQTSRAILASSNGKIFGFSASQPMSVYKLGDQKRTFVDNSGSGYFMSAHTRSKDGKTLFVLDYQARLYKIDIETHKFTNITSMGGWNDPDIRGYAIALSLDEKKIYMLSQLGVIYEYDRAQDKIDEILDLRDHGHTGGAFTGMDVTDSKGRVYFATHGTRKGILQVDVSERTGLAPVNSRTPRRQAALLRRHMGGCQLQWYGIDGRQRDASRATGVRLGVTESGRPGVRQVFEMKEHQQ